MTCSASCPGCSESDCLAAHHCTDSTDISRGIFFGSFSSLPGVCSYKLTNPSPWDQSLERCFGYQHVCESFPFLECPSTTFPFLEIGCLNKWNKPQQYKFLISFFVPSCVNTRRLSVCELFPFLELR